LQIGDKSLNLWKETASFGWLLIGIRMSWYVEWDLLMVSPWFLVQHELNYLELRHWTCCYFTLWSSIRLSPRASAWSVLTTELQSHG
jgi:hypothetical protein